MQLEFMVSATSISEFCLNGDDLCLDTYVQTE